MKLTKDDLKSLAHGACFFACGGGGAITTTLKVIDDLPQDTCIDCVSLQDALADKDAITATVAFMGAPDAIDKSIGTLKDDVIAAFDSLKEKAKEIYGREINYLIPIEIGALNLAAVCLVANEINEEREDEDKIIIIDADGAGRAVPQLTLLTYAANGLSCNPTILSRSTGKGGKTLLERSIPHITVFASSAFGLQYRPTLRSTERKDYSVSLEIESAADVEDLARIIISNDIFDQYAGLAIWPMDSEKLKQADPVEGYVTQALKLGRKLRDKNILIKEIINLAGKAVFEGKLHDIQTSTSGGFDHGLATLENGDETFYIYIQNESILGWSGSGTKPEIMAPDLICYLAEKFEQPTGCPEPIRVFSNATQDWEECFQSKQVIVVGRPCDEKLRREQLKQRFHQLRIAFGYPGPYIPFE